MLQLGASSRQGKVMGTSLSRPLAPVRVTFHGNQVVFFCKTGKNEIPL